MEMHSNHDLMDGVERSGHYHGIAGAFGFRGTTTIGPGEGVSPVDPSF